MRYRLLDDQLIEQIASLDKSEQSDWLILSASEEFPGYWDVEGLDHEFFYDFDEIIGRYRLLSPARVSEFLEVSEKKNYRVAFTEDPQVMLGVYEHLKDPPPVHLNSVMENTVNGMLPWQVVGFNKLIRSDLPGALAIWDTGTGKTALIAAAIRYHLDRGEIDLATVVVKAHNKIETKGKLMKLAGIESIIIDGYIPLKRFEVYEQVENALKEGPVVVITNYEKFRDDPGIFEHFVDKRRVLFCWDEMPTKLSNRGTKLYASVKKVLYRSFVSKPRPSWMRHIVASATPIERDPDGLFSMINLIRPRYLGTVTEFQAEYVSKRNFQTKEPELWSDLDKLEAKVEHMTHRVSKADPDVAAMFPEVWREERIIDWNLKHRAVYDRFTKAAEEILKEEDSGVNVLSLIQVMQMLCDAPSMIKQSAANRKEFLKELMEGTESDPRGSEAAVRLLETVKVSDLTDAGHTKLEAMKEIILEKHPDSKIVVHSTWASYIFPVWHHWLDKWGVSYVTYYGTDKQKQAALDRFRDDPSIRVFLSGDAGSDSIDIPQADVGISYNGAWKATTMKQREGRRDRVTSEFDTIYTYDLAMADSVEDRKREIRNRKQAYHDAIFEGRAVETALSARMTSEEFRYLLLGERDE